MANARPAVDGRYWLAKARSGHTATILPDGRVLGIGIEVEVEPSYHSRYLGEVLVRPNRSYDRGINQSKVLVHSRVSGK